MRFKIWHLMALTLLIALTIAIAEWASYRTVSVRFVSPSPYVPPLRPDVGYLPSSPDEDYFDASVQPNPTPTRYYVDFETCVGEERNDGTVFRSFGYNSLLKQNVNLDNLSTLDGVTLTIRYRFRSLPWAPATQIENEISKHFDELLPKSEWQPPEDPTAWMFAG